MSNKGQYWYGNARTVVQGYGALTATNNAEYSFWAAPFACKIVRISVIFDSAVTGAATNNFGVRMKNKGPVGVGTAVMATKTFSSGVNAIAYDKVDLDAVSNNLLNEGDTVTFEKFENSSGANMPALSVEIEYVRIR